MGMTARLGLGFNQVNRVVTGSRSSGVTYYNTTGRPILVHVLMSGGGANTLLGYVDGVNIAAHNSATSTQGLVYMVVPPGSSYKATAGLGIQLWTELTV